MLNNKLNWYNNMNVCLGFFSSIRNFPTTFYLHGARINFFLDSMFSMFPFYCLCVLWKITLSKQFQKGCSRKPPLIFFFVTCQVCFYFTAHMCLKKTCSYVHFFYLSKCVHTSAGGVNDRAPVTTADRNFCCLPNRKIISLVC